ncbi:hypothetical protein hrd7_26070 [Leptolinea sp. HRD-7]|nr:hypothetical protein hrd7_26070 [Leptolinea sp. HRD-7]
MKYIVSHDNPIVINTSNPETRTELSIDAYITSNPLIKVIKPTIVRI